MKKLLVILLALIIGLIPAMAMAEEDNLLAQIQEEGVLHVGTNSSHQPWAFKDENDEFVGCDMDLIREIASRIGVEVEITDMAFDALVAAVQTGKVDCAICSMGAKPERLEKVDFTQAYHAQGNCLAVVKDSDLTFTDMYEMVDYKVGALVGSIPEGFVEDLIEEGRMPADQLYHYSSGEEMILDLLAGRIDVVAWDQATVKEYMKQYDIEIALVCHFTDLGENIAVPKNQPELLDTFNAIIDDLREEGWLEDLYQRWGVDE